MLACVTAGGGLRLLNNSGSTRFSLASTEWSENQLVRLGMDRVSSGGREVAVGEVGEVAAEVVVEALVTVVGGCGGKDAKPVTDELDDGDTTDDDDENGLTGGD